nr:CocE/NonD family hydrolase [candidate division Zixibacteria bacterium]
MCFSRTFCRRMSNSKFPLLFIILLPAALAILFSVARADDSTTVSTGSVYPINILEDKGRFLLYVNEEVIVTEDFEWKKDGSFKSDYTTSIAGQSISTSLEIAVGDDGRWNEMTMKTVKGDITVTVKNDSLEINAMGDLRSIALRPKTIIFENFSPALMSQAVMAYDQEKGGKQTFPLFIVPAVIMDGNLERIDTQERAVAGEFRRFTLYRYGLPGVDVTLWVDDEDRICFGDVPAQHAVYVREGYEVLMVREEADSLLSQPKYEVRVEKNVMVPMRDGIRLATDIYLPDSSAQFPVILVRTPYKKEMNEIQGRYYARRGYAYAVQDCRGRFGSEGEWVPFFNEPEDGYDAIEWLAVQPWSNGKVGMIGASYLGWVQWWAARENPPHLVTIIPNVSPPDPYFNIPYEYGAFFLLGSIWWADVLESEATADISGKKMSDILDKEYNKLLRHLPVIDIDSAFLGTTNTYWRDWIKHPNNDEYWARASFLDHLKEVDIPVYHQSGWYDGDGIGSKLNYLAMAAGGHQYQKLVLGPWGHSDEATRRGPNNTDFGPRAIVDMQRSYTRWLDHWLLGIDNGIEKEPLVSLFVMGSNNWLYGEKYPLPETQFTKFYLASKGTANTSQGDGWLTTQLPGDSITATDSYTYDPADPTPDPTVYLGTDDNKADSGKVTDIDQEIALARTYYGRVDEERSDILVYETAPLEEPMTIAGPISAVLYAATSAKDTDWNMRISKIEANGDIFRLAGGVIRARYHKSFDHPELLEPGQVYQYHLDLWQTGMTFEKGTRLRLEVASAAFPKYSRNLNTGGHNEIETDFVTAEQTIYHSPKYPSHILLPVIPNPNFKDMNPGE